MKNWLVGGMSVAAVAVGVAFTWPAFSVAQQPQYRAPRTSDGKPDLNGIWQALNTAYWDIEDHVARQGPVFSVGAAFSVPEGYGIVEGGELHAPLSPGREGVGAGRVHLRRIRRGTDVRPPPQAVKFELMESAVTVPHSSLCCVRTRLACRNGESGALESA